MSLIVAGRFNTFAAAENTAHTLFGHGFIEEDVFLFFVNPPGRHDRLPIGGDQMTDPGAKYSPKGALQGAAIGAAAGAIIGVEMFALFAPLFVAVIAAGVGAWIGSLIGAMTQTRGRGGEADSRPRAPDQTPVRQTGVLLAVHVNAENQSSAAGILRAAGGQDVERASGHWSNGRWTNFDPREAPHLIEPSTDTTDTKRAGAPGIKAPAM